MISLLDTRWFQLWIEWESPLQWHWGRREVNFEDKANDPGYYHHYVCWYVGCITIERTRTFQIGVAS